VGKISSEGRLGERGGGAREGGAREEGEAGGRAG
jgi:hypothetical protein